MFSRLKGAIDSRIAEEQARAAKAASVPPARSSSTTKRPPNRDRSSSKATRPKTKVEDDGSRGPDPSEFEGAFALEDDSEPPTRLGTPLPEVKTETVVESEEPTDTLPEETGPSETPAEGPTKAVELPADVRAKLRKLDKLEARYQELLRSYRIAHSRAIAIEPFEKCLKENTPLTTIKEPDALVEYLQQLNLRGDMVMDELKRVTSDRDGYKKKFEEAEAQKLAAKEELENLALATNNEAVEIISDGHENTKEISTKSPVQTILGVFSPKAKATDAAKNDRDLGESFFSYDEEIPQLQEDLKTKSAEIQELKEQVETLQSDLKLAKSANTGLEESLRSLEQRLSISKVDESTSRESEVREMREKLEASTKALEELGNNATNAENKAKEGLAAKVAELTNAKAYSDKLSERVKELLELKAQDQSRIKTLEYEVELLEKDRAPVQAEKLTSTPEIAPASQEAANKKKKNNKKKKGANVAKGSVSGGPGHAEASPSTPTASVATSSVVDDLQAQIEELKNAVAAKDEQIERLQTKRKTEEDLRAEIENMEESLLNLGQEHVEAKQNLKELHNDKKVLQDKLEALERDMYAQQDALEKSSKDGDNFKNMTAEFEDLKVKSAALQTDLGAAQQLATSRYKDLTELREVLHKAQPELKSLRSENASLKSVRDDLTARTADLRRLEAKEKELRADVATFKKQAADRESDIKTLNEKITQESNSRLKAEDQARVAGRDLRRAEAEKIELSANSEKAIRELQMIQEEAGRLRQTVRQLDSQVAKLTAEGQTVREEVELKTSQYANAQGLVGSMRDQTAEMAMQLKEVKEQAESLEEELAEVQRLLGERTRDAETMRRLLSDVDERTDTKVREMRERMEAAIEERDRAEEDASTSARRRSREVDDLKNKIKDAERDLKRAIDEKEDLLSSEKEWKRRREDLEKHFEDSTREVQEVNVALEELRDALNKSERQSRDGEKQRNDLRKLLDDANQRYEKLQKSLKSKEKRLEELSSVNSSRSSIDDSSSRKSNGTSVAMADSAYLKTVLLQFLEQKDKKLQAQLVPVLGKLLHFDKKDEQKWTSVIAAR